MKHIVFAIGSLFGGGSERVVSVWASALAEKGYRVSVIVYSRLDSEYPISDKVEVYPIAESQRACSDMSVLKRVLAIRKLLRKLNPDVVISFLPIIQVYVRIASLGLRLPRIETIRISPWDTDVLSSKHAKLWFNCFETCSALILQSQDQKAFFSEKVQKKSVVIPNPINPKYVETKKDDYDPASHKIVAAGRLSEQKNYKMMIDAVKIVSEEYADVSLRIYGVGSLEQELSSYIKAQGVAGNVKLMGRTNELYNVYKEADLYVMSSDYEGMPNALAEAMAIGLPCISTDCKTGPRDLIDDGENGFLVPCGDSYALAEKIKLVFGMSEQNQRQLGCSARNKIIDYCGETSSLDKLVALIESI